jgi:hypothetical protein
MRVCPVCGNEEERSSLTCGYCGCAFEEQEIVIQDAPVLHRRVNLEQGRPPVETAMKRLEQEISLARTQNIRVLSLIHGYGSSGKGGLIRIECRKMLAFLVRQNKLNGCIHGETFNKRSGAGKALLRRFPGLEQYCGSDFRNPGVSIAIL